MATIRDAINANVLEVFSLPAYETRLARRSLYVALEMNDEITDEFYGNARKIAGRTLDEHLEIAFSDFRCDERPNGATLRSVMPVKFGVWKMHSPGLRVYGWCPNPHEFVAVTFQYENESHSKGETDLRRTKVLQFCKNHHLEDTIKRGDYSVIFPKKRSA